MGRWLKKLAESPCQPTDRTDRRASVGSVSTVQEPFEEKTEPTTPSPAVELVLYSAKDLKDLSLLHEDQLYIDDLLRPHTGLERHALLTEYRQRWQIAAQAEPLGHRKTNAGRFAANTWLRHTTTSSER